MVAILLAGILLVMVLRAMVAVTVFTIQGLVMIAALVCSVGVVLTRGLARATS